LQKLLGTINWVQPLLDLNTQMLAPLFDLLKGDPDLLSSLCLTAETQQILYRVEEAISARKARCVEEHLPVNVYVVMSQQQPIGLLAQWNDKWKDPLYFL
ncbi:PO113 protein, partial [Geococcyx californianus]|nr:PO113 protein [Geococcyx californianus]